MPYNPPFNITEEMLNLVADISQQVGKFDSKVVSVSPQLRKQNRIKTITGTLAIEGNTLNQEQITAILEGKTVMGMPRELAEVSGAIAAYEAIPSFNHCHIKDLLHAHNLLMSAVLSQAGCFRNKGVGIFKSDKINHVAPPAKKVSGLIVDLMKWLKNATLHPLIKSCIFHYEFEFIHPFSDGNGRMGRLWQTLILYKWHPIFLSLPIESVVCEHQKNYYLALEKSDQEANSTAFILFMLHIILKTLIENDGINDSLNDGIKLSKIEQTIVEHIANNASITVEKLALNLKKSERTIERYLKKLKDKKIITREGANKTGYWKLK